MQNNQTESPAVIQARETLARIQATGDKPSGAGIDAVAKSVDALIKRLKQDQELRKWAVEKAVAAVGSGKVRLQDDTPVEYSTVELARQIYTFLMTEQQKVVETLEGGQ